MNTVPVNRFFSEQAWIEGAAIAQLDTLAKTDRVTAIAAMPDLHPGKYGPVGCAMLSPDIHPMIVGSDIGCVDADTEFLSPTGWIRIASWNGEDVCQFDPVTNIASFVTPLAYVNEPCSDFIWFKTKYGVDQMVSDEHRMLLYKFDDGGLFDKYFVRQADEQFADHERLKLGSRHKVRCDVPIQHTRSVSMTNADIRLFIACLADCSLTQNNTSRWNCNLKKQRKIERLSFLLKASSASGVTTTPRVEGATRISFDFEPHHKDMTILWDSSPEQLRIITDEVLHWDGSGNVYHTRKKAEADFIQYAFAACGYRAVLRIDERGPDIDYRVFRNDNTLVGFAGTPKTTFSRVQSTDGRKYCFTVSSGFFVIRRGGNIAITGNCGMGLFMTDVKHRKFRADKVADRLRKLDQPWDGDHAHRIDQAQLTSSPFDIGLGTIGGGNHFCELQAIHKILDAEEARKASLDPDLVFVLVHSGSRAYGFSVLDGLLAKGVKTLAVDSDDGGRYLFDHNRAVEWAALNREIIAERAAEAARASIVSPHAVADLSHNFLEVNEDNTVLHRKGAAPADRGLVPIPGSRESLSYLVKPLASAPATALASLAHGAGRKYDRGSMHGRIQKVRSVREQMTHNPFGGLIVCEDRDLLVEEAGSAYKNIDRVIADLVDFGLIRVVATFRPLITFKTGYSSKSRDR